MFIFVSKINLYIIQYTDLSTRKFDYNRIIEKNKENASVQTDIFRDF